MKRFLRLVQLCIIMLCIAATGCSQNSQQRTPAPPLGWNGYFAEETVNLVYVYSEVFPEAPDNERVIARLNELTKEKINVTVTLESYSHTNIGSKIDSKLASGQQIDILFDGRVFTTLAARNALAPLDDLLPQYGNNMINSGFNNNLMKFNGIIYGIAYNDADFGYNCLLVNADMAKRFGLEDMIKSVRYFEDMEDIFRIVREKDPFIKCYIPTNYGNSAFQGCNIIDGIRTISTLGGRGSLGVILNNDNYNVVNLYETPEYAELLDMSRRFFLKGYFPKNAATLDVNRDLQYQSGEGFSVMNNHRALKYDEPYLVCGSEFFGVDSWVIPMSQLFFDTRSRGVSISAASENKEAAMAWLSLVSTDKEIYQLLAYGIEGEHYIKNENGTIRLPDDCASVADTGYETSHYFLIGDMRNRLVWDTISDDPDYYFKLAELGSEAIYSNTFGFVFDDGFVSAEVAACLKVVQKYSLALETGSLDPKTELPKFIDELNDAGINAIIQEKQRQLDLWLEKPDKGNHYG